MASRDDKSDQFLNSDAIDNDFFISIVEKKLKIKRDEFKLRLVLLSPATGKNENYVAVLYRAKIKIEILATKERKSVDVIIKALLSVMKELKEFSVFPRERFVYDNILTSFENIWHERTGSEIQFGPKIIKSETDPYELLVLDDLKAEGYEMLNRKVGLNKAQTKVLLTKLAKFHASSTIRYQQEGVINEKFFDRKASMPPMPEDSPFVAGFRNMYEGFCSAVEGYGDCDLYADKIRKWDFTKLLNQWIEVATPMRCGFQVMNHGDMWLNNMMFKSDDEGNPLDVSMIDYQGPFWASPANDILYFLISSVADDIKVEYFDEFIEHYHSQLTDALKQLKYDQHIPTLAELHIDFLDKGFFAGSCIMFILFVVKYDSPEEINIEMMMTGGGDDPNMMDRIYNNENYKAALKAWLPFLNRRGFLDAFGDEVPKVEEAKKAVTVAVEEKKAEE